MLVKPKCAVLDWWCNRGGRAELLKKVQRFEFVGDGWIPLLVFLPQELLDSFVSEAHQNGTRVCFVATQRETQSLVQSELHHWVIHDLERRTKLNNAQRSRLDQLLLGRADLHAQELNDFGHALTILLLERYEDWPRSLTRLSSILSIELKKPWVVALGTARCKNATPTKPVEGILLTLRMEYEYESVLEKVENLLVALKQDTLCDFLVVLALDQDELEMESLHERASTLTTLVSQYATVHRLINPSRKKSQPFPICQVWDSMASKAFSEGASWVVLLGDDISIDCSFHYRALYRAFLDISRRLDCPFGFGCPWWNDRSFPGFPTFPVIGRIHFEIFGALIPKNRRDCFVNQDLDPYLQRLYLKFGAAPLLVDLELWNQTGGNTLYSTRYDRVSASGWRNWVLEDVQLIHTYLANKSTKYPGDYECFLVDIVVPTFRIDVAYLTRICSIEVPDRFRSTFIIVVDNPPKLMQIAGVDDCNRAALWLETYLVKESRGNNIRVRCNSSNLGASTTRNRGIKESAAEYILFLDDDVKPNVDLLRQYETALLQLDKDNLSEPTPIVGLVGLVSFPRSADIPFLHAAVLMSYLTFMFEIAEKDTYRNPAWGVTANILVKRVVGVYFETDYAKTGGGEDVDFCLVLSKATGGRLLTVPKAEVSHDFWPGGLPVLIPHFFNWAVGDGALFNSYREHTYRSFPNIVEFGLFFLLIRVAIIFTNVYSICTVPFEVLSLLLVDTTVDMFNCLEFNHRCEQLKPYTFPWYFYVGSHVMANFYVSVLESGRLYGHLRRGDFCKNTMRRFDWHCGRLPYARENFVRREQIKFGSFVGVSSVYLWCILDRGRDG